MSLFKSLGCLMYFVWFMSFYSDLVEALFSSFRVFFLQIVYWWYFVVKCISCGSCRPRVALLWYIYY